MQKTKIYSAKKIYTMNPCRPIVSHVAVKEGKILGAGSLEELASWGDFDLDDTFSENVIMPGFVEGHAHTMEGTLWRKVYLGWFDRTDPNGKTWRGLKSLNEIIERLSAAEKEMSDDDSPLSGWSVDPIYMNNQRISRQALDQVSQTRPIGVLHASGHILNVNSKGLELAGLLKKGINHPGIPIGNDGYPTGELYGPDAMTPVGIHVGFDRSMTDCDEQGLRDYARLCVRAGVTTCTDLAARLTDESISMMLRVTGEANFPACIVPLKVFFGMTPKDLVDYVNEIQSLSTERLRLGRIKAVLDGSIQGFSARLNWPGYFNGAPNGLWYTSPEQLLELYTLALKNNLQIHTHTNGDQATQLAIETLDAVLKIHPSFDHRFTLQHCQLASTAQFRKMSKLGMCVNLFANHHYYWGDEHYRLTVGPERAERMNACRTALDANVNMAIHSDAPITPLAPLFTAWCAVNRLTVSDRVQGAHERISIQEAMYAITLGAAYTLHMDQEIGSIEIGKRADFAILEDDPFDSEPDSLKDIAVWGTVQGGRIFEADNLS